VLNPVVLEGDCVAVMAGMEPESVDAVICDPPYGLEFMGKEWDSPSRMPGALDRFHVGAQGGAKSEGYRQMQGEGMRRFQGWCQTWAREALRVLKPGGHLLAFGGSRTYHRLACAVEDAGFEIRDMIDTDAGPVHCDGGFLSWKYGSGFPKSLDVSKAIDKAAGAKRQVVGVRRAGISGTPGRGREFENANEDRKRVDITAPATPDAERWQGWGTALKPGAEPIVCARKPLNVVPCDYEQVARVHHALAALVCLLSSANTAANPFTSSPADSHAEWCASARANASLENLSDESDATGTIRSTEAASIASNIASSWSAILAALSRDGSKSTTETATRLTTGLKTLSLCLSPITSHSTMPVCACLLAGDKSSASAAAQRSSADWLNWIDTLRHSALGTAIEPIAQTVYGALASIADEISIDPVAGSSARPTATTSRDASRPSHEPIVVARKPLVSTVARNVLEFGTGALNIDACRIGSESVTVNGYRGEQGAWSAAGADDRGRDRGMFAAGVAREPTEHTGRWPANVMLVHADDCNGSCVDGCPVRALDEQSGTLTSSKRQPHHERERSHGSAYGVMADARYGSTHGDKGGASRFFATFEHSEPRFRYVAKASTRERGLGLPEGERNGHPCVKPIEVMRWLVRLVTPPNGLVLDPFCGSGTTGIACVLENKRFIGIEQDAEYARIARARIQHHASTETQLALDAA
jgi:DNA modification methylase